MNTHNRKDNPEAVRPADNGQSLRSQAEEKARTVKELDPEALGPEETRRFLHELRVHQIELEMQNEDLRLAHEALEASRASYFDFYDLAPVGYVTVSEQGTILEANLTAAALLGVNRGALIKQPITRFILPDDQDIYYRHSKQLFETHSTGSGQTGEPQVCEMRMQRTDSPPFWARIEATAAQDRDGVPICRSAISDITEQKRTEETLALNALRKQTLLDLHLTMNESQPVILEFVLEGMQEACGSRFSFIGLMDETESFMTIHAWSKDTMAQCSSLDKPIHFPISEAGLWGDCVRQRKVVTINDYEAPRPGKKGYPAGHVPIRRFLSVPIFEGKKIVAVAAVANKKEPYTEDDERALTLLLNKMWEILRRKKAEESLQEANRELQASQTAALNILEDLKAENQVRKAKEAELERVMMAIEQAGEVIMITDPAGMIQYLNPAFETVTGYGREEAVGKTPGILKSGQQDQTFYQNLWETITSGRIWQGRMVNQRKDGTLYTEDATISPVFDAAGKIINYVGVKRDVTAHLELTAQLQQAQKMESVGRLAGGVAHDFSNKLTVMLGYTQMVMESLGKGDPKYGDLQEVMNAGQQSVAIVRQLLAFARKQIIRPRVLNLNETMEDMLKMLRRLIGEDIDLVWSPGHDLWQVKMDPSQLDQILANLCVNARDAISEVGKVTIETENVVLDQSYCDDHPGCLPGEYVMLAVNDDGIGMDRETLTHAFEPFFTTKEVGKGTGLGLATVYGIVKQNQGFVNIYSEPGKGTGFKIYLSRHLGEAEEGIEVAQTEAPRGRGETILVVEDETSVLHLAERILERLGYAVLTSASPAAALSMAREYQGEIHLLMTDVVLPEMSGRDLAGEISKIRPNIKTMFMSGYTAEIIAHQGVLDKGVQFIEKPFSFDSLARKVREAIGTRKSEIGTGNWERGMPS